MRSNLLTLRGSFKTKTHTKTKTPYEIEDLLRKRRRHTKTKKTKTHYENEIQKEHGYFFSPGQKLAACIDIKQKSGAIFSVSHFEYIIKKHRFCSFILSVFWTSDLICWYLKLNFRRGLLLIVYSHLRLNELVSGIFEFCSLLLYILYGNIKLKKTINAQ